MPTECIGKEVNKTYLDKLNEILTTYVRSEGIKEETIPSPDQVFLTNVKDEEGKDLYLLTDTPGQAPEKYSVLSELIRLVDFEKTPSADAYEIPGVTIKNPADPTKKDSFTIYLTKENAKAIANDEKKYRDILGIEFPDELFQLYHENIIPGLGYQAPLPKKYSETEEDYELRMEAEYKAAGHEKEALEQYRKPYPHELVRYNNPAPQITDIPRESYNVRLNQKGLSPEAATQNGPGTQEGERRRVVDTNPTLGQKLYRLLQVGKGITGSKESAKRALLTVATGVAVIGPVVAWPLPTLAIYATTGVMLGSGYLVKKYGTKLAKAISTKWNDWLRGKAKTEQEGPENNGPQPTIPTPTNDGPEHSGPRPGTGNNGSNNQPRDSKDTPNPIEIPEDLEAILQEIQLESEDIKPLDVAINNLKGQIEIEKQKLDAAPESEKDNIKDVIDKMYDQLNQLVELRKKHYLNIHSMLQHYVNGKKETIGGPSL